MRLTGELGRKPQQIAKVEQDVADLVDDTNRLNAEADMLDQEISSMRYDDPSNHDSHNMSFWPLLWTIRI